MKSLQNMAKALLDKVDQLLTSEPARMIGYGSAAVVYLVVRILSDRGIALLPVSWDQSVTLAFGVLGILVVVIESIRRFVYSPQTYIENLSDEAQAAHQAAHMEEALQAQIDAMKAQASAVQPTVIGSVLPKDSSGKAN